MENVKESCCFPIWSWLANFQLFNFCRDIAGITLFRCLCCNPTIVWAIKPFLLSLNITSTTKNLYTIFWSFNCSTLSFFSKRILWIVKKVEQKWNFVAIWVKMGPMYPPPSLTQRVKKWACFILQWLLSLKILFILSIKRACFTGLFLSITGRGKYW